MIMASRLSRSEKKPKPGVFASTAHKPKELTIVPAVQTVVAIDTSTGSPSPQSYMKFGKTIFNMLKPGKHVSMIFHVRSSDKAEECNCAIKKMKSDSGDYPWVIECTVICNTKKIAAGDELVLYREKAAAKAKPEPSVVVDLDNLAEPATKKAKGSAD